MYSQFMMHGQKNIKSSLVVAVPRCHAVPCVGGGRLIYGHMVTEWGAEMLVDTRSVTWCVCTWRALGCFIYLRLLVTTRASPSRCTTRYLQRLLQLLLNTE